jgi:hypothetical protein
MEDLEVMLEWSLTIERKEDKALAGFLHFSRTSV